MITPYENLANAIIEQAVKDYRNAEISQSKSAIIRFFRSDYFRALTDLDPEMLIEKLKKEELGYDR